MALADQVYGFYIPTVTLMGIGSHKELGKQIMTLGGKKPFICTDKGITKAGLTEKLVRVTTSFAVQPFLAIPFPMSVPGLNAPVTFTYSTERALEDPTDAP